MLVAKLFENLYRVFSRRRRILYGVVLLLILASLIGLMRLEVQEDIEAMLPDGRSGVARDFRLLQKAPFARKVLVHLQAGPEVGTDELLESADRLAAAMQPPYFSKAVAGPTARGDGGLLPWLLEALPNLLDESDLRQLQQELSPTGVRRHLQHNYTRLLSPEGWVLKELVRRDPLELRTLGLQKLRYINPVEKTQLKDGRFVSGDGRSALIIAETAVPITDSQGGRQLIDHFAKLADEVVSSGIRADLVSGHPYTVANAETIKSDLVVVLGVSVATLLMLFLLFLRDRRALYVFLVPVAVVGFAAVAVSAAYESVSGITLGFGAVLLGITVDFALHVYFALQNDKKDPGSTVGRVARPVLFGGLTTLGAFAVLLFSDLPGQRQLAVFSMTGIGASLLFSLAVLPHLIGRERAVGKESAGVRSVRLPRSWIIGGWLLVMVLCGWQASQVRVDGELRKLTRTPEDLRAAERQLQQVWGNLRGKAMLFAEGEDMQTALERNDRLFAYLRTQAPDAGIVSLAGLLPARSTQKANRERWETFWQDQRGEVEAMLREQGAQMGFSPKAFAPFLEGVMNRPDPVTREAFGVFGMKDVFNSLVIEESEQTRIVTLVPDSADLRSLFDADPPPVPGVHLVSQTRFGAEVSQAIEKDFVRFISLAGAVVVVLLSILFRNGRKVALALLPVVTGLVVMFGVMGMCGIEFNLFNIIAAILIIGLGVDYGIFMVCRVLDGQDQGTEKAVLVSGLTTLAGFGALALARHPALYSIGITVLLGITPAVLSALWVIPALCRRKTA